MIFYTADYIEHADAIIGGVHASDHIDQPSTHMRLCTAFADVLSCMSLEEINKTLGKNEESYTVMVDKEDDIAVILVHCDKGGTKIAGRDLPSYQEQWDTLMVYISQKYPQTEVGV
jgi:hypothetical protein